MDKKISLFAAAAALTLMLACAAGPPKESPAGDRKALEVKLITRDYSAGGLGKAVFVEAGEIDEAIIYITGFSHWISRPVRIFTYIYPGTCKSPGAKPAYEMNETTLMDKLHDNEWKVAKKLPVKLRALLETNHAIVIRSSPGDGNLNLFCGDIR
jgi:hypothetical protein